MSTIIKTAYQGDYASEFGGHPKGYARKWKVEEVWHNEKYLGAIECEPEYHNNRFKAYYGGTPTFGDYLGGFETHIEAVNALKSQIA